MGFFENVLTKKSSAAESVALVDIGADSVAGAYARYESGELPTVVYARRTPIEAHAGETLESAMLRALKALGADMIREGAPALARAAGSGSVARVIVSIETPWQETAVRVEEFERSGSTFEFTHGLVAERLGQISKGLPGKIVADESVIGTTLNGYETSRPYGKKAHRASVTVLASIIERRVAQDITAALAGIFHTRRISPVSGSSLRYQTIRNVFPHERDAVILDAAGRPRTAAALVRNGTLVSLTQTTIPVGEAGWAATVKGQLAVIAEQYPLPRTIFLLARKSDSERIRQALAAAKLESLWLSENPPKTVAVMQKHLLGMIRYLSAEPLDTNLLYMALYYQAKGPVE